MSDYYNDSFTEKTLSQDLIKNKCSCEDKVPNITFINTEKDYKEIKKEFNYKDKIKYTGISSKFFTYGREYVVDGVRKDGLLVKDDEGDLHPVNGIFLSNCFHLVKESAPQDSFKKFDTGKPDYSLFEPIIMEAYCKVGTMGAKKYGRNNWKKMKVEDYPRLIAAQYRHDMLSQGGEELDLESGLPHLWHSLWNLSARIYLERRYGYAECRKQLRGEDK